MAEKMVGTKDVDICTESFGGVSNPTVVLIMGASASMLWWPADFCCLLADRGLHVIRFDNRDTGRSTTYPPGQPGYVVDDLVDDIFRVQDAYDVQRAHLVGMSLGGMIAQLAALSQPKRVASITLMMSSIFGPHTPELPAMDTGILEYHRAAMTLNWLDRAEVIEYIVGGWRLLSGTAHAFDDVSIRDIAREEVDRASSLLSMFNHAMLKGGERSFGKTNQIAVPTLVIHGTADPALPYPHGVALANEIPKSRLVTLRGTGHELHREDWDAICNAIAEHTLKQPQDKKSKR